MYLVPKGTTTKLEFKIKRRERDKNRFLIKHTVISAVLSDGDMAEHSSYSRTTEWMQALLKSLRFKYMGEIFSE